MRGKATINNMEIAIAPTEARSLGGTVTAEITFTPRSHDIPMSYVGKAWVRGVDMALVGPALDLRGGEKLQKLNGRGFLDIAFQGQGSGGKLKPADAFRADGELQILGCHFWDDPVLGRVASDVKTRHAKGDGDAAAVFSIADSKVTIHNAAINSPSVGIEGSGTIGFDKQLDLKIVAVPIGDLRDKLAQSGVPILGDVAGAVVGAVQQLFKDTTGALVYQYRVTGPATNPTHEIVPAPVLTDPVALIFGRMLKTGPGGPDDRLIDAVRPTKPQEPRR